MKLTNSFVISSRGSKVDPYTRSTYSNKRSEGRVYRSAVTSHSDFWQTAAPQHAAVLFRHRRRSLCSSARVKAASDGASAGFLAERERRCILYHRKIFHSTLLARGNTPRAIRWKNITALQNMRPDHPREQCISSSLYFPRHFTVAKSAANQYFPPLKHLQNVTLPVIR